MPSLRFVFAFALLMIVAVSGCSRGFDSDRRQYESDAEKRLAQYRSNWNDLLSKSGDRTEDYGGDWGDLSGSMTNNLGRAEKDLNRMRKSSGNQWSRYRNDWERLMSSIGDQFDEAQRRVRRK